jgi:alginate O-acetyltransferase complex protein AlgI
MLFNSYEFIFLFLPVAATLYFWIGRYSHGLGAAWLAVASLIFYGYWNPIYLPLLIGSITANFLIGRWMADVESRAARRTILVGGLSFNLLLLGYFKYVGFLASAANDLLALHVPALKVLLPLGISFFTFTQIAFLVDVYEGKAKEYRFVHYVLFVTFFPHLIAGPILHHKEMMPQFARPRTYRLNAINLAVGLTIFFIGLGKKAVIADSFAPFAAHTFDAASQGSTPGALEAWGGTLAYALQLYFDFSGYSDMAIGLARLFGIKMPLNFLSPYKAVNIIDFWRRWHMTLSRFLRQYLYIPLGGNRKGKTRRYVNLMITMALGGLWHGAGWTFAAWGALHGVYLAVNHAWHAVSSRLGLRPRRSSIATRTLARLVTFSAVMVGWVFFRADSMASAGRVLAGMAGLAGIAPTLQPTHWDRGFTYIGLGMLCVWFCPNTYEIMARYAPNLPFDRTLVAQARNGLSIRWRPSVGWAYVAAVVACTGLLYLGHISEFLYFQF